MYYLDTQDLSDYSIKAKDGEIGHITDFYFDEKLFYLRYLVVDTEPFLARKLVLLSPISFYQVNIEKKLIEVFLTKKEIEDLPPIDSVQVVSREYEKIYNDYFTWPYYWGMESAAWAIGPYGVLGSDYSSIERKENSDARKSELLESAENCDLRSSKEICSYSVKSIDDKFGHIQGFVLDPKTLSIDFIIIDIINYLPSKHVLLRPEWLEKISWGAKSISFPFTKELIKSAPTYDGKKLDDRLINETDLHFESMFNEKNIFGVKIRRNKIHRVSEKETVVGHIPSGLFIVTVQNQDTKEYEGFVASWIQQASFNPLLVSLCIKDGRPGIKTVLNNASFCINIMGDDYSDYTTHFFNKQNDDGEFLDNVSHQKVDGKGVFINGARSVIICKAYEISHPGDHYVVIAEVTDGIILNNSSSSQIYLREEGSHY